MAHYDAGDVIIPGNQIWITTYSGGNSENIFHLVRSFDIYESLDNFSLCADFYVADGIELSNYLPVGGEERIIFSMQTPDRKLCSYNFLVESVQGMKSNDQSNLKLYKLQCVTQDFFKNKTMLYTKRYTNMEYQDAIAEIVNNDLGSSKPIEIEPTKGFFDYVVNSVRPFQTIEILCERAVSKQFKSSKYVFYEDHEKYRFVTLEYLVKERKSKAESFEFFYDTANRQADYEKVINVRNILSYETVAQGDSMNRITKGGSRIQVREFDILHGDYFKKFEYVNSGQHTDFEKLDNVADLHSDAWNADAEGNPGKSLMVLKDGSRPDMKHNETIHYKRPYEQKVFQYGVRIRVYGDTSLMVGDVVKLRLPDISGVTKAPPDQQIYSGNYLVKTVRHMCQKRESGEYEHYMILDLRKSNLKKALG